MVAAVALVLVGCSGNSTSQSGSLLRLAATDSGPFTEQFNPLVTSSATASGYSTLSIYEQLMVDNYTSGEPQPWLAASHSWSKDGKSLTINIRQNEKWSDGSDLTADDVAFTFNLLAKYPALNAQALPLVDAKSTGRDSLVVNFSAPAFQAVWWRTSIVPQAIWSKVADPVTFTNPKPVGSGPFALESFTPQVINLTKNKYYWNADKVSVSGLRYLSYDSDSSALSALEADQVDWISPSISNPQTIAQQQPNKIGFWATPRSTGVIFLVPNLKAAPLDDVAVRQAINVSLDRQQISDVGLNGLNAPIQSPTGLNPDNPGEAKILAPEYKSTTYGHADSSRAKEILAQAGYTLGGDGFFKTPKGTPLELELQVPTSSAGYGDMVGAGRVIVKQLAASGIKVDEKSVSPSAWRDDVDLGNFQLSLRSIGGTLSYYASFQRMLDPTKIADVGKKALYNYERYGNPAAGTLLKQWANAQPGSPEELAAAGGLEKIMATDVPLIPLYLNSGIGMWRTDHFSGWPSQSNPYATSTAAEPGLSLILAALKPNAK
ncbi:MAG TPA: ABC transporter substrate-binding protein [Sinomonas sp.]|nr:ABC transporter substrate-binding protein [Sinomonas sp.]